MAPAPSSAMTTAEVATEFIPSVVAAASVVGQPPSMGIITVSTSTSSSGSGKNDGSNSGADQESSSESLSRSLSGSKLNAKAPEFVPKGVLPASVSGFVSGLNPAMLLQPPSGVIPITFSPVSVSTAQFDQFPVLVSSPQAVDATVTPQTTSSDSIDNFPLPEPASTAGQAIASAHHPKLVSAVSEELKAKIVKQVEFYFSDANLPTDNYLMKLVKKDPEGFVPIPVVSSFRKIKSFVKNYGIVAAALRSSTQLVVSEDGKKVRRAQPLPDVDMEEIQSRTVVAENLPEDHSIENMEQLFGSVGKVKMVRMCHPEDTNGATQTAAKYPKTTVVLSNRLHALVEFETVEQAEKAVAELTDERNWRKGMRVRLLLRRTFQSKHGYQQAPFQKARKPAGGEESGGEEEDANLDKGSDDAGQQTDRFDDTHAYQGNEAATSEKDGASKRGRGRGRGRGSRGRGHHGPHHPGSNGSRNHQLGTSPQTSTTVSNEVIVGRPPPGPRMPDGTRGFTIGRGRILTPVNTDA